jgi:hypothetical protein
MRQFGLKSDVHVAVQCLALLATCLEASPAVFAEFGGRALEDIWRLLAGEPVVPAVDLQCWESLRRLVTAFPAAVAPVVVQIWLEIYRMKSFGILDRSTVVVNKALAALSLADDIVPALLERGALVLRMATQGLRVSLNSAPYLADPGRASEAIDSLDHIPEYFAYFLEKHRARAVPFFLENLDSDLQEWLAVPGCKQVAILMYGAYLTATGDCTCLTRLVPIAQELTVTEDVELSERLMQVLGALFGRGSVDRETALVWYDFLIGILTRLHHADDLNELVSDHGLCAVSWLLRNNLAYFHLDSVIPYWAELFPMWVLDDKTDVVYALLADFIESGHPFFADVGVLQGKIEQVIIARGLEGCSRETGERLLRIIMRFATAPESAAVFQQMRASLKNEDRAHLDMFLDR